MIPTSDTPIEEPRTTGISEGEYHRLLSSERRRVALEVFDSWGAPYELGELAAAVASMEADDGEPDDAHVEEAAVMLHHVHLPMLSEIGVIEYDEEATRIVPSQPAIDALFSNPV